MSTINTLVEVVDKTNSRLPEKPNGKLVFYPVNRGFFVDETILNITRNYLSSLCVQLIQVGTNEDRLVQVKKISMPHKGETFKKGCRLISLNLQSVMAKQLSLLVFNPLTVLVNGNEMTVEKNQSLLFFHRARC